MNQAISIPLAAVGMTAALLVGCSGAQPVHAFEQYEAVHGRPELPHGELLGQATAVDVDSKGNVWVFHRAGREWSEPFPIEPIGRPTVWVFDGRTGRLLKSWGANTFVMPTDVAVADAESFFVSDGYGNARVLKFTADGTLLLTWGCPGTAPGEFDLPHGIAIAQRGRVLVADRSNAMSSTPGVSGCRSSCRDKDVERGDDSPAFEGRQGWPEEKIT